MPDPAPVIKTTRPSKRPMHNSYCDHDKERVELAPLILLTRAPISDIATNNCQRRLLVAQAL
jgi:hypothetical protein